MAFSTNHQRSLCMAMEESRRKQIGTDCILQCNDGEVHAHKFVLTLSCPYFQTMFSIGMSEQNSSHAKFEWCSRETLETVVKYLYTGKFPRKGTYDETIELLNVSHMMQLQELFVRSWKDIGRLLNTKAFPELWMLGLKFGALEKSASLTDFANNEIRRIVSEGDVGKFDFFQMRTFVDTVRSQSPEILADCIMKWKGNGDREKDAAELLKSIGLEKLSGKYLQDLIMKNRNSKVEVNVDEVLIEEAVRRLQRKCDICKSVHPCDFNVQCQFVTNRSVTWFHT